eukprot:TRINITY_DN4261_c0_g1::TRINITY_DN4261_c0_g1_i1::g.8016::m.8016 TRINITY_DN4261_c0_g1::TRINITY_DN4261_c0_g1_i1::g.8016  ORF type:complete len:429 (-),score=31.94,zf-CCCH/PF00642.19/2.5e-07 TRINITY_DN4261_c0_g1_i1:1662-2948(-)
MSKLAYGFLFLCDMCFPPSTGSSFEFIILASLTFRLLCFFCFSLFHFPLGAITEPLTKFNSSQLFTPGMGIASKDRSQTPCMYFARGECKRGDQCLFLHEQGNMNAATSASTSHLGETLSALANGNDATLGLVINTLSAALAKHNGSNAIPIPNLPSSIFTAAKSAMNSQTVGQPGISKHSPSIQTLLDFAMATQSPPANLVPLSSGPLFSSPTTLMNLSASTTPTISTTTSSSQSPSLSLSQLTAAPDALAISSGPSFTSSVPNSLFIGKTLIHSQSSSSLNSTMTSQQQPQNASVFASLNFGTMQRTMGSANPGEENEFNPASSVPAISGEDQLAALRKRLLESSWMKQRKAEMRVVQKVSEIRHRAETKSKIKTAPPSGSAFPPLSSPSSSQTSTNSATDSKQPSTPSRGQDPTTLGSAIGKAAK